MLQNQWKSGLVLLIYAFKHSCVALKTIILHCWLHVGVHSLCVCVCVSMLSGAGQHESSLICCITAVILFPFITASVCYLRFKIFQSAICLYYEVNPLTVTPVFNLTCVLPFHMALRVTPSWPASFVLVSWRDSVAFACSFFNTTRGLCSSTPEWIKSDSREKKANTVCQLLIVSLVLSMRFNSVGFSKTFYLG